LEIKQKPKAEDLKRAWADVTDDMETLQEVQDMWGIKTEKPASPRASKGSKGRGRKTPRQGGDASAGKDSAKTAKEASQGGSTWQLDESGKAGPATAAPTAVGTEKWQRTGAAYGGGWTAAENAGSWKATQNGGCWKAAEHGGGWKKASKKDRVMDDWFSQRMAMAH